MTKRRAGSHVFIHPFVLEAAKVCADRKPRDCSEKVFAPELLRHPGAEIPRAHIKPDDGIAQGLARVPVPHNRSLSLVGDT